MLDLLPGIYGPARQVVSHGSGLFTALDLYMALIPQFYIGTVYLCVFVCMCVYQIFVCASKSLYDSNMYRIMTVCRNTYVSAPWLWGRWLQLIPYLLDIPYWYIISRCLFPANSHRKTFARSMFTHVELIICLALWMLLQQDSRSAAEVGVLIRTDVAKAYISAARVSGFWFQRPPEGFRHQCLHTLQYLCCIPWYESLPSHSGPCNNDAFIVIHHFVP